MAPRNGTAPSTERLRELVRSAPRTPGRSEAFIELVAREPRGLNRTLSSLALDPKIDQAMRVKAVAALGRKAAASSLEALRTALSMDDEVVRFRAIERLGKVGAAEDLALIEKVRSDDRTTLRALHAARLFLSYRHRLAAYRFETLGRRLSAESPGATPIHISRPTKAMTNRLELVSPPVAGIELVVRPVARLECGRRELALMMNREVVDVGAATLAERQAIPAVLLSYNTETGTYDPDYYLMTDPVAGDEFRILGVRSSGRVGLQGTGTVGEDTIGFELNSTEEPLSHPMSLRGSYVPDRGLVRFDSALVDPQFGDSQQARRKQPRPAL
jgi:hypothetical protein